MPFALGTTNDEEKLLEAVRDFCIANELKAIIAGENKTPRTQVIVDSAEETQTPTRTYSIDGKLVRVCFWRLRLDLPDDEIAGGKRTSTHAPRSKSNTQSLLCALFDPLDSSQIAARNSYGIYGAKLRKAPENRDGVRFKNPYVLECSTLTYLE